MQLSYELVLASESPRRKQLLEEAGFQFTVFPLKVSENLEKNLTVNEQIMAISEQKWRAASQLWNQTKGREVLVLAADTMVVFAGQALGKPRDSADAVETLSTLSGHPHQVITALTLGLSRSPAPVKDFQITQVFFRLLLRHEILEYVQTGEPFDKAGSYAIQGLGGAFVQNIQGDFDNVVGLPMTLLKKLLREQNWLRMKDP